MIEIPEHIIDNLKRLSRSKAWEDDENLTVFDYAGSNIDDAYSGGISDGEILLARSILQDLNISY